VPNQDLPDRATACTAAPSTAQRSQKSFIR